MTKEDAIAILKHPNDFGTHTYSEEKEALEMAIKALERDVGFHRVYLVADYSDESWDSSQFVYIHREDAEKEMKRMCDSARYPDPDDYWIEEFEVI